MCNPPKYLFLLVARYFAALDMAERTVLRKDQLEISLHNEKKLIKEGAIKDDNPLDLSEPFRDLCKACRKGDLKVCQEKITEGVNVNARDSYDYTPLILVSGLYSTGSEYHVITAYLHSNRQVSVDIMKLCSFCLSQGRSVSGTRSKVKGTFISVCSKVTALTIDTRADVYIMP